jgi:hypothetical protein
LEMFQFPIKIPEIIFGSNLAFFLVSYPDSATPTFAGSAIDLSPRVRSWH